MYTIGIPALQRGARRVGRNAMAFLRAPVCVDAHAVSGHLVRIEILAPFRHRLLPVRRIARLVQGKGACAVAAHARRPDRGLAAKARGQSEMERASPDKASIKAGRSYVNRVRDD